MTTPFYDRSEAERIALTLSAIESRRTMTERWQALGEDESAPWNARAAKAAGWLAGAGAVADLGCGTMILERHLAPDQGYVPVDVVARDARTVVCDFNREPLPPLPATAAACLGLLEYLFEPGDFLGRLAGRFGRAVVSYCVTDAPGAPRQRREHAWVNDLDASGLEALLLRAGWTIEERCPVGELQLLWRLRAPASRGGAGGILDRRERETA